MDAFKERLKQVIREKSKNFCHMRDSCKIDVNILSNGVIVISARRTYFISALSMGVVDSIYKNYQSPGEIILTLAESEQYEVICAIDCGNVTQGICYQFRRSINSGEYVYLCRNRYELLTRSKFITLVGDKPAVIGPYSSELNIISTEPTTININAISECVLFAGRDKLERNYIMTKRGYRFYINPEYTKCVNYKEFVYAAHDDKLIGEIVNRYYILSSLDGSSLPFVYNINKQSIESDHYEYYNMNGAFEILYNRLTDPLKQLRWNNMTKIVKVRLSNGSKEYYAKCGADLKSTYYKYADYAYAIRQPILFPTNKSKSTVDHSIIADWEDFIKIQEEIAISYL
jgi:hypothetical protein